MQKYFLHHPPVLRFDSLVSAMQFLSVSSINGIKIRSKYSFSMAA